MALSARQQPRHVLDQGCPPGDLQDDIRRCKIIREEIGWDRRLMMDANQVWDVSTAIDWMRELAPFKPWFIEEPTNPDDVLGHAAIAKGVANLRTY